MQIQLWQYLLAPCLLLLIYLLLDSVRVAYKSGIRNVPGPTFARWSNLWRITFVWDGKAPWKTLDLHEKYGPVIRTGPNSVVFSDPAVIPLIYGVSSKYYKARTGLQYEIGGIANVSSHVSTKR